MLFSHEASALTYSYFPYLGFRLEGSEKARITTDPVTSEEVAVGIEGYQVVEAVPLNEQASRYELQYEIADLTEKQDILMHVNMRDIGYNHWYNVQLRIDVSGLPGQPGGGDPGEEPGEGPVTSATYEQVAGLIADSRTAYEAAVEGTGYGEYTEGSKSVMLAAIEASDEALNEGDDEAAYAVIYNTLLEAREAFAGAQRLADRTELTAVMSAVRSFLSKAKRHGETEGAPGSAIAAIHPGEYYASNVDMLDNAMAQAQRALDNPASTPEIINQRINGLNSNYQQTLETQYVAGPTLRIYPLDSLDAPESLSVHAADFDETVTTVMQRVHAADFMDFNVNLTLRTIPDGKLNQSIAIPNGMPFTAFMPEAGVVSTLSNDTQLVFQLQPVGGGLTSANDGWLGLSVVRYEVGGETRTVYISYNVDLLEALGEWLDDAEELKHLIANVDVDDGEWEAVKTELEEAIDEASAITSNLASQRPVIRASTTRLAEAYENVLDVIGYMVYYSVVKSDAAGFSELSPALLNVAHIKSAAEGYELTLLVEEHQNVRNLQLSQKGEYVDPILSEELPEDEGRLDTFLVEDLSGLVDARAHVYSKANPSGSVQTFRLNFNDVDNAALAEAVHSAHLLLQGASIGGSPGQYPVSAAEALTAAIEAADAEAVNLEGTAELSAAAADQLSTGVTAFRNAQVPSQSGGNGNTPITPVVPTLPETPKPNEPEEPVVEENEPETGEPGEEEPPTVPEVSFTDVERHWAFGDIQRAVSLGLVNGYEDGTFRPDQRISRAEFAVLVSRALQLEEAADIPSFKDWGNVPAWARAAIASAASTGIIGGYEDGTFRSDRLITRSELVVMISRVLQLETVNLSSTAFADDTEIPQWAKAHVAAAHQQGLISGRGDGRFDPLAPATRAEAVKLILALI
ncbi:S-layer homology domain-containing protein [Paenibacillus daejeonensis]|uniref:S-layer homology domain-containing protein n=1 Tax=Paenibacillus daejeonensis TaxID=135193 RepID=UPI00036F2D3A|nr:S-layer homology domain-containing protein [Paenibacillus daejeonensis]